MKSKLVFAAFLFVLGLNHVAGQTKKDLEKKYGRPETDVYTESRLSAQVYLVSKHIWMAPLYDAEGQVCLMRLYPKRFSSDSVYLERNLDMDEVLKFINKLFPLNRRGARKEGFGLSGLGGGTIWTGFGYDNVTFTFISFFKLDKLPEHNSVELEPFDFNVVEKELEEARRKEAMRPDDELIRERAGHPKFLEVRWANRKCVEQ